jgi:hypothetical protein
LVWRTGLSGVPPDSVRCTRVNRLQLLTFGFLEKPLRYNSPDCPACHQTVRCASGATATAQRSTPMETCKSATVHGQCVQSQSRRQKAHRTVNSDCPVHHQTVRWPHLSELQQSNPNGWVTWLAHQTVSGGAPDCPVRPSTDSLPNGHFGGWGYKYPPTTTLQGIQVFQTSHSIQELVQSIQDTNPIESKPLQVPFPLQANSD